MSGEVLDQDMLGVAEPDHWLHDLNKKTTDNLALADQYPGFSYAAALQMLEVFAFKVDQDGQLIQARPDCPPQE